MRRAPRTAATAALTGALLTLAGCGVPTSGVIDAGAPAFGVPARIMVYFVAADGLLRPVPRRTPDEAADPVTAAVRLLLAGPDRSEARTLTTSLPAVPGPVAVSVGRDVVSVRFPAGVGRLDNLAMEQLTCTAADTLSRSPDLALPSYPATPAGPVAGGVSTPAPQPHISVRAEGEGWATARSDTVCPGT
ncbi:hypothetical protein ABZ719_22160 [Streptomyces sp. NPDC006743]|uniref:GerMN domain-containing protein n=1 Tax=Streptomyces sp. NPDC006743 TaxID=3154480 RepID=UPI0034556F28